MEKLTIDFDALVCLMGEFRARKWLNAVEAAVFTEGIINFKSLPPQERLDRIMAYVEILNKEESVDVLQTLFCA